MPTKIIRFCFGFLFFTIPLIFFPRSSELFEFNKIVLLYVGTTIITTAWIVECILTRKFIFKRTLLDIPLILFLSTQLISTVLSIDPHISIFGYYSRFNGGFLSSLSYVLLYWSFVTYMNKSLVKKSLVVLLVATIITSLWGALEHFGKSPSCLLITGNFDVSCWVQDVRMRVYATFGQPNWMAAWTVALVPILWAFLLERQKQNSNKRTVLILIVHIIFFAALLFTKSRSGIIALLVSDIIFWIFATLKYREQFKARIITPFIIVHCSLLLLALIFGSPFNPNITELLQKETTTTTQNISGPALETGGTESGEIRKIVWAGALNVWKQFPILGSGVETFALSYYAGRPMEHNLVSEWNFLYNKAHNEYLNYLATTGVIGFGAYMLLIGGSSALMLKIRKDQYVMRVKNISSFDIAFFSGFLSILITNFFGFSVVPVSLLFFMFPAFSLALHSDKQIDSIKQTRDRTGLQTILIITSLCMSGFIVFQIYKYWHADYLFARAHEAQNNLEYAESIGYYQKAIAAVPNEATYHADLASLYSDLAVASAEDKGTSELFASRAITQIDETKALSAANVKLLKSVANSYSSLGDINPLYIEKTLEMTRVIEVLAPTDPSVMYQRSLTLAKLGRLEEAITAGEHAVEMKVNYKIARRLLSFLYKEKGETQKAKEQLEYILKNISPDDEDVKKELNGINQALKL